MAKRCSTPTFTAERRILTGITERGDAGINLAWTGKTGSVEGTILITKHITDAFIGKVADLYEKGGKFIVHATITGWGGVVPGPEEKVPTVAESFKQLYELIRFGFPAKNIVLRIDPIIPTEEGLGKAAAVLETLKRWNTYYQRGGKEEMMIRRVRVSLIDMYPHVRKRFEEAGLELPYGPASPPSPSQAKEAARMLAEFVTNHQASLVAWMATSMSTRQN